MAPSGVREKLTSAARTEAAAYLVATLGCADVLCKRALDYDFVGWEDCINRSIASEVLAVLAPADTRCDGLGGDSKSDLATKAATKIFIPTMIFIHRLQCFRTVA